jgi:multidrug efflux pump
MFLSDISVTRPVFASVISLLLIAFGLMAFDRLPLRQYPDIDPPVVSIDTTYPGASAAVVENRITELIEERIAGVSGIKFISSSSEDGRSRISVEFDVSRDIDAAANDIRDRVSGTLDDLPDEADPPDIQKADSNDDVIIWLNLTSDRMSVLELTDYADRYVTDRFSALDGVARVRIGGGLSYAMRIWLDRTALAARGLTVNDVEAALRAENVELPAGSIESRTRQFTVRTERTFLEPEDFRGLVLGQGRDGYLIRLGDVARVEKGAVEDRTFFRGNATPMVGIGIIKQSQANTVAVAKAAIAEARRMNEGLPEGMSIEQSYDTSVFIESAIWEVYNTLFIAIGLVVLVIYLFLGSVRATLVPAVTVPVSLIGTFIVLYALGFSINLLTLLALVLAIGLVVDDAIVVLENVHRRVEEGEPALVAAYRGTRQVGFAVIATTMVLIAVFVPIAFLQGDVGRLFSEFALTMAAAVALSGLVALTLSPMMASKILARPQRSGLVSNIMERGFDRLRSGYGRVLRLALRFRFVTIAAFAAVVAGAVWLFTLIPQEFTPQEDQGAFFVMVDGPEGASFAYMSEYMNIIEERLMPLVESGEVNRLLVRAPRQFGTIESFNSGIVILALADWSERRSGWDIMSDVRERVADLPGVRAFPVMRQGFGSRTQKPVQFVIGGGSYDELAEWRDILLEKIEESNPGLEGIDYDYKETKPQLRVVIDRNRADDLGVTLGNIGRTLETILGARRVTTYSDAGREYDIMLQGERDDQRTPGDIENIYVRSERSGALIPLSNLVTLEEAAVSPTLNRYNRVRAITLEAGLAPEYALGDALAYLEGLVSEHLPASAIVDYRGQSRELKASEDSILFVFALGVIVVFLVLAAQFESYIHPFVILLTVPLAMAGALLGIYLTGGTLNLYSQIGLIMLVGLAAKNGILIVEFANQLRDAGKAFDDAIFDSALIRLRPVLMTAVTTAVGAVPLIASSGAGAETRFVLGTVVFCGMITATLLTLFVVPVAYHIVARHAGSPGETKRRLHEQMEAPPQAAALDRRAAE